MSRVVVTGASRGLGLELVRTYARRGDDVVAVVRASTPELHRLGATVLEGIDLASEGSASLLSAGLGSEPIDAVIANAGVNFSFAAGIGELDLELLQSEFAVNVFGVVRTVKAALPNLGQGSKIAVIGTWRPGVGAARRNYGYQMTKMASTQLTLLLADDLRDRGVSTVVLSPGPMDTELLRVVVNSGHVNLRPGQASAPSDVAVDLIGLIDQLSIETSGSWLFRSGESLLEVASSRVWGHG